MDYTIFYNTAKKLLTKFGAKAVLQKPDGRVRFNPETKKNEQHTKDYDGICIKTNYVAEGIGVEGMVIEAGDVILVCQFPVEPTEITDKIVFGDDLFNVIQEKKVQPDGRKTIIYIVQGRRA